MMYLTDIYAVNIDEPDQSTAVDWHCAGLDWSDPYVRDTSESVFGELGIYYRDFEVCGHRYSGMVASHVRACLDMMELGHIERARGMREDFIGNEALTGLVLREALRLRSCPHWPAIDELMGREYGCAWLDAKEAGGVI